jgi:N-acetylglucosamine repressor
MARPSIRTKHQIIAEVEADFLKRIRIHGGLSRVDLARKLRLAPSTAGIYADRLLKQGFLLEGEEVDRKYGRRPTLLTPNPRAGRFIGVDFEAHSLMTTVVDFSLQIVHRFRRTVPKGDSVERILKRIEEAIRTGIEGDNSPLLGIGVGVPGIIDTERGVASSYEFVSGWENVPVGQRLKETFNVPISVENNIRSMAMAELWLGQGRGLRNFVCLGIRTGIGVGIVINHELYAGSNGGAGEIGSWPNPVSVGPSAQTLEEAASLRAILEAASSATGRRMEITSLKAAIQLGDPRVQRVLEQAATVHAAICRQLQLLFDPERIIVVGPLAEFGSAVLSPILAEANRRNPLPPVVVVNSTFGEFGGALGAAALALHRWKPQR